MIDDVKEGQQKSNLLRRTGLKVFCPGQNFNHHFSIGSEVWACGCGLALCSSNPGLSGVCAKHRHYFLIIGAPMIRWAAWGRG